MTDNVFGGTLNFAQSISFQNRPTSERICCCSRYLLFINFSSG